MKTLKIGIILLAFLLAAMVTVPMVNAKEQATTGANVQLPHLQPDDTQQKTVIQNGFSLANGDNMTILPEGAIIQHSTDGVTRVFDSNGKQISISNDADSPKISTPEGYVVADKITQIPNGSYIQDNDNGTTTVYLNNQRILTVLSPSAVKTPIPATTGGWVEYADASGISSLSQYSSYWVVPTNPSNTQTVATSYIFNAIEPYNGAGILQPLIEFNGHGNNRQWTAAPYYVDSSGNSYPGTYFNTASSHEILGQLLWNTNLNAWDIIVTDENTAGSQSQFSVSAPNIGTTDDTTFCALEAYSVTDNTDIPGSVTFTDLQAENTNYNSISFNWATWVNNAMGLSNLGVTTSGMSYVALST